MSTLTVGSGQQFATITSAVAAARPGDTITIQAGTYINDFPGLINGLTLQGIGTVKLVATSQPGNGKAYLDVAGDTTLRNLDISGVTVPDANGAAVRYESGNLVLDGVTIHGNQDGILGAGDANGTITIKNSEFYGNGTGTGSTHNIYIGNIATFTLTDSYIHDANTGHEVKSRAETNIITNNRILDNSGTASYEIDLPNGGNATISGNTIQKSASSGNRVSIAYGEEGSLHAGKTVSLTNNTIVSDQSNATVFWDAGNGAVTASGNSIYGFTTLDKSGIVTASGFSTLTARPSTASGSSTPPATTTPTTTTPTTTTPTTTPPVTTAPVTTVPVTSTPTPPVAADKTAPTLSVMQNVSGTIAKTSAVVSGSVADAGSGVARVDVYDSASGAPVKLGVATITGSSWSFAANGLSDGFHAFSAIATDAAGNASANTYVSSVFKVDVTPASLTAKESVSGVTTQNAVALSGTVSDGSGSGVNHIEVYDTIGGVAVDLGRATIVDGNWTFAAKSLALGSHAFSAIVTDNVGNVAAAVSAGTAVTVVAAPPTEATTAPTLLSAARSTGAAAVTIRGSAQAGASVSLSVNGQTGPDNTVTAGSDGSWSITSASIGASVVNRFGATASLGGGSPVSSAGSLILSGTGADRLTGTASVSDVFAFTSGFGRDTVTNFESFAATGGRHDVLDLAGLGYQSFAQLQSRISSLDGNAYIRLSSTNAITLTGVSPTSLTAADFRFT